VVTGEYRDRKMYALCQICLTISETIQLMRYGLSSTAFARAELVISSHLVLGLACVQCNCEVSNFLFIFMSITVQDHFRFVDIIQLLQG
jgi:hypothetical protein